MKKRTFIMLLGLWIAIVPILGLPASWKSNILIVSGLVVALLAATRKNASNIKMQVEVSPVETKEKKPRVVKNKASVMVPAPEEIVQHNTDIPVNN